MLHDFASLWPDKFTNVTNGVTPRRFIKLADPRLAELITGAIGGGWLRDLSRLAELEPFAEDPAFLEAFAQVKRSNKTQLAGLLAERDGLTLDPTAMFDVMVKRLHEYKRQTLKLLHVITLYQRLQDDPDLDLTPRVVLFGAKAAPGYMMAKHTIALINAVARTLERDPLVAGRLQIAFPANYNVTLAERLIPAADLSEQISLAGKEASGTGNMKLALNGALTVGTLDGANVEILELVGRENFFLFGLTEPEVDDLTSSGYRPHTYYESNPMLRRALDAVASGEFSGGDRSTFAPVVDALLGDDRFLALADYQSYIDVQDEIDQAHADTDSWHAMAVRNIARCGFFSSDRAIKEYVDRIWHLTALPS